MIKITQGDFGQKIECTFDVTGNLSFSDVTVKATLVFPDKTKTTYTATVTDATNRIAEITVIEEMTAQLGVHTIYWHVENELLKINSEDVFRYQVIAETGGV